MDQYIGSNKLTTYLHPNSTDPFELKTEPENGTSTNSSNLIDICVLNSFYQQLVDTSPVNTSSHKSLRPTSNVRIQMPRITHVNYPIHSNSDDNDFKTNNSTSVSRAKVSQKSSLDQCVSNELPKVIADKRQHLSSAQQNDNDITSDYQLSSKTFEKFFLILIEILY
jgi:hypothetical protein